jgi:hypothetical protein
VTCVPSVCYGGLRLTWVSALLGSDLGASYMVCVTFLVYHTARHLHKYLYWGASPVPWLNLYTGIPSRLPFLGVVTAVQSPWLIDYTGVPSQVCWLTYLYWGSTPGALV